MKSQGLGFSRCSLFVVLCINARRILTVDVKMLESVQYWLHQAIRQALQLIIPQLQPLQGMKMFKGLIGYLVDAKHEQFDDKTLEF